MISTHISKYFAFIFLQLLVASGTMSQTLVLDQTTQSPLANVIVLSKGLPVAKSDAHGHVFLSFEKNDTLTFLLRGYTEKTIPVSTSMPPVIELTPNTKLLSEVVVSLSRNASSVIKAIGTIDVIPKNELMSATEITSSAALTGTPGLHIQEGTYNTNRITIRGMGSRSPYSTNRIKAFLGDIPLTDGEGVSALEDIEPESTGRIEVLKGASSALYGSGLGGVIRFFPSYPLQSGAGLSIGQSMGSYGLSKTNAAVSYKKNNWAVSTNLSRTSSNGYRENSQFKRNSALLSGNWFGKKNQLHFILNYADVLGQIPSSINADSYANNPSSAASNWLNVKGYEEYTKLITGATLTTELSGRLSNSATFYGNNSRHFESRPFNILDDYTMATGLRNHFSYNTQKLNVIAGIDYHLENYHWKIFETDNGTQKEMTNKNREVRQQLNIQLLSRFDLTGRMTAEAGVGFSRFNYELEDLFQSDSEDVSGSYRFENIWSPRAGINYSLGDKSRVYILFSKGFSPPSVEESLLPEGSINTDLKPEIGTTYELGSTTSLFKNHLVLNATVYKIFVSNLLVTKRLTEDTFMGINAGKTEHKGIELHAVWEIFPNQAQKSLSLATSYTYSQNRFTDFTSDGLVYDGNALPGIPAHSMHLHLNYSPNHAWSASVISRIEGMQYMNDANTMQYPGHAIINLNGQYSPAILHGHKITFFASVKNVFDKSYASMILINAPSFGNAQPRYYYPARPRNYVMGIKVTL